MNLSKSYIVLLDKINRKIIFIDVAAQNTQTIIF